MEISVQAIKDIIKEQIKLKNDKSYTNKEYEKWNYNVRWLEKVKKLYSINFILAMNEIAEEMEPDQFNSICKQNKERSGQ